MNFFVCRGSHNKEGKKKWIVLKARNHISAMGAGTISYQCQQLYQRYEEEQRQQFQNFWNERYKEIRYPSNFKNVEMDKSTEIRDWAELIPDALGIIFNHLSLQEKLMVVPCVCKSWGRVVSTPDCWQEIDLEQWSRSCSCEKLDRLLRMLVRRGSGSFSKLAVHGLRADALFSFVADNAGSLQTLIIPGNSISDSVVEQVANRFTNITTLDLSFSAKMSAKALEAFGKNCKNLTVLHYSNFTISVDRMLNQDDETFAVSSTMPKLLCLDAPSLRLSSKGLLELLYKCKELELLNIDGCTNVMIKQELLREKYPNAKVIYEPGDQEDDDDYSYLYYEYDPSSDGDFDYGYEFILDAYGLR